MRLFRPTFRRSICAPGRRSTSRTGSAARRPASACTWLRSEEHTFELQSRENHVCRLLLEKKNSTDSLHRRPAAPARGLARLKRTGLSSNLLRGLRFLITSILFGASEQSYPLYLFSEAARTILYTLSLRDALPI